MANPFAHIELTTTDLALAKGFYAKIFNWKLTDMPSGPTVYTMVDPGNGTGGGMQAQPMPDAPVAWLPYVEVDDVQKTLEKVEKAGGKVMLPVMDIGPNGTIGIFTDPAGASLGVWAKKADAAVGKASKKATKKASKKVAKKAAKKAAKTASKKAVKKAAKKTSKKAAKKK
jgi:uncharacterized protein